MQHNILIIGAGKRRCLKLLLPQINKGGLWGHRKIERMVNAFGKKNNPNTTAKDWYYSLRLPVTVQFLPFFICGYRCK